MFNQKHQYNVNLVIHCEQLKLKPVRLLPSGVILALLLSIMTGFGALFLLWNVKHRANFLYEEQDISLSTHFLVKEMFNVPKKQLKEVSIQRLLNYEIHDGSFRPVDFPYKGLTIKQIMNHQLSRSHHQSYLVIVLQESLTRLLLPTSLLLQPVDSTYSNILQLQFDLAKAMFCSQLC